MGHGSHVYNSPASGGSFAAEFALIANYSPEWNGSGYGSKVPGVGRPGTSRVSSWNAKFRYLPQSPKGHKGLKNRGLFP